MHVVGWYRKMKSYLIIGNQEVTSKLKCQEGEKVQAPDINTSWFCKAEITGGRSGPRGCHFVLLLMLKALYVLVYFSFLKRLKLKKNELERKLGRREN